PVLSCRQLPRSALFPYTTLFRSNKLAVALPNPGVKLEGWVASDGVWQVAQPIALKSLRPLAIEVAPPGEVVEGVGWSRNCMNATNSPTSLVTVEALVPPEWVMSSG